MYELKNLERYLRVNLLGPGPRLMKKRIYWAAVSKIEKHWFKIFQIVCSCKIYRNVRCKICLVMAKNGRNM